jgi:hypothetical protein
MRESKMGLIFIVDGHRDQWSHDHFMLLAFLLIRCLILSPAGVKCPRDSLLCEAPLALSYT